MLVIRLGGVGRCLNVSAKSDRWGVKSRMTGEDLFLCLCLRGKWNECADWCVLGGATWLMLWPEDGKMMKDDIRATFDGSIFYVIAERRAKGLRSTPTSKKF